MQSEIANGILIWARLSICDCKWNFDVNRFDKGVQKWVINHIYVFMSLSTPVQCVTARHGWGKTHKVSKNLTTGKQTTFVLLEYLQKSFLVKAMRNVGSFCSFPSKWKDNLLTKFTPRFLHWKNLVDKNSKTAVAQANNHACAIICTINSIEVDVTRMVWSELSIAHDASTHSLLSIYIVRTIMGVSLLVYFSRSSSSSSLLSSRWGP